MIAHGGDNIEMRDCVVTVNGVTQAEPYLDPTLVTPGNCGPNFAGVVVRADHFIVMGDNRPGSGDSRGALGQIAFSQVEGKVIEQKVSESDSPKGSR